MSHLIDIFNLISCRIIILSSGESLLLSILLLMPRRNGVFLCMEVEDKQLEFSLRYVHRENLINKIVCLINSESCIILSKFMN